MTYWLAEVENTVKTQSHSLASFIRRTETLHRELRALIKRYPEDTLEPDDKIFNRLLTNDWRHLQTFIGPLEKRYIDVAEWVSALTSYHSELQDFCVYGLGAPAKLNELPMHPALPLPASECLNCLELQFQVLQRWQKESEGSTVVERATHLRAGFQSLIKAKGQKTVEAEVGVNKDRFGIS
jgi:hypothetical protein